MSDTTTTITPEERAQWFKDAQPKSVSHYEPIDFELDKRIRRLLTALEAAEAENARLRAERDWLAENIADRPCAYDSCPFGLHRPTGPDDDDCDKTHAQCWKEAASRAVRAEKEEKFLTAKLLQTGCVVQPDGSFFLEHVPGIIRQKIEQAEARADFASSVLQAASDCIVSGDPASDVGLFLECDEFDKKLLVDIAALRTRAEQAEAENARLRLECGESAPEGTQIHHVYTEEYVLCPSCDYEIVDPWDEPETHADAEGWHGVITCRNCSAKIEVHSHLTHFWTARLAEEAASRAVAAGEG